jgi:hypothetical protein
MRHTFTLIITLIISINISHAQFNLFDKTPKDTLEVVIVNEEREPVEGATIRLTGLRSSSSPGSHFGAGFSLENIVTNEEGEAKVSYPRFVLEKLPTSAVTLEIIHPDYSKTRADNIKLDGSSNPIVLSRGSTLSVKVTLDDKIIPTCFAYIGHETYKIEDGKPISGIIPEVHSLYIAYEDEEENIYYSDVITIDAAANKKIEVELELYKGLTLNGTISEDVPLPIKTGNVIVNMINDYRFASNPRTDNKLSVSREFPAKVSEDGSFTIKNLPKGLGEVISICDAFVSAKKESVRAYGSCQSFQLTEDGQELTVAMEPGASITGTVTDEEGNPLKGVMVACSPNVFWGNGYSTLFMRTYANYSAITGNDGRYIIKQIPADDNVRFSAMHNDYEMVVEDQENQDIFTRQSIKLKPGELISIDFKMKKKE